MDLLWLVFWIAMLGCGVWVITTYIPMDPIFKRIIYVIVALALFIYLMRRFGSQVPNVLN